MAKRKNPRKKIIIISIVVLLILLSTICAIYFVPNRENSGEIPSLLTIPDLSTKDYIQVSADAGVIENIGIVTLTGNCYQLVANTDAYQALSVFNGMEKRIEFRPDTHDLMKDTFDMFGIEVLMVRIVDIKNDTFIGDLVLKQGNNIVNMDSKPSDGIAIAVRTGAPIFIKESLMMEYGEYIC